MVNQKNSPSTISLVVATRDRPADLEKFVNSVENSTVVPQEVIVVDQSSDENWRADKKFLSGIAFCKIKHIRDNGVGLSRARNIGIREVAGDIVGFPDDDCWYPVDIVEKIQNFFETSSFDFLCGSYREELTENMWHPTSSRLLSFLRANTDGVCSVGLFVKTDCIRFSGIKFNEQIGAGTDMPAGEEVDFVLHLLRKSFAGKYDPTYFVYHSLSSNTVTSAMKDRDVYLKRLRGRAYIRTKNAVLPFILGKLLGSLLVDIPFIYSKENRSSLRWKVDGVLTAIRSHWKRSTP